MNQKELEITEWLVLHKEGLQDKINKQHNPAYKLLPDSLFSIYLENYKELVLSQIKKEIVSLEINPEEINEYITIEYISKVLGEEIFKPV